MPRPAVSTWFDSEIRIWRPTPETDSLGVEAESYTLMDTVGARLNRSTTTTKASGGGLSDVGTLRWYGLPTIDVLRGDVCEVISGPDKGEGTGRTWEVDEEPVRPANHHCQVDCVEWHGVLPEEES